MNQLFATINAILAQGLPGARLITQGKQSSKLSLPLRLAAEQCASGTMRFSERRRAKMLTILFVVAPPPQVYMPEEIVQENGTSKIVFDYGQHGMIMEFGPLEVKLFVPLAVASEYCAHATQLLAVLGGMIEVEFTSMQALPQLPLQQLRLAGRRSEKQLVPESTSGMPNQRVASGVQVDERVLNAQLHQFLPGLSITKANHANVILTIPVNLNADDCRINTDKLIAFFMQKNYPQLHVALLPAHSRQGTIGRGTMSADRQCINDMGLAGLNLCIVDGMAQLTIPGKTTMDTGLGLSQELGRAISGFSTQILFVQRIAS